MAIGKHKKFFHKYSSIYQFPAMPGGQWISVAHINRNNPEAEENAKLLAAAPELLEALKAIIPYATEWINENHPAMKLAKSAIQKAELKSEIA